MAEEGTAVVAVGGTVVVEGLKNTSLNGRTATVRSYDANRLPCHLSIERSVGRSIERSIECSIERSIERSIARSVGRSIECSIEHSIEHSIERCKATTRTGHH